MGEIPLERRSSGGGLRSVPGIVLWVLLALLLVVAAACPRDPSRLAAAERTQLAAAGSLARDFDWRFAEEDRRRLEELGGRADELLLTSDPPAEPVRFAVPKPYAVLLAPFVRLAPLRGAALLNTLLLAVAVGFAGHRLERRLGRVGLAVVAVCVFGSVLYRSVFLATPGMLLAACVATAFSLVLAHEEPAAHGIADLYRPPSSTPRAGLQGLAVGILLGLVALHHPLYLLLLVPAAVVIAPDRRQAAWAGLLAGGLGTLLPGLLTGGLWNLSLAELSPAAVAADLQLSVGASLWNLLYLAVGRNVGVLPYFLPLVALLGLWKGGTGRSLLVVTAMVGLLLMVIAAPFDFFGGPAAVGSFWLIPWFVLLWFVPTQPLPKGWIVATLLLAAPAMTPAWLATSVEPVTADGVYRHAAGPLQRYLPVETTQRWLPPGEVLGNRFWIRSLSRQARASGGSRWLLEGTDWAVLHLAAPTELAAVHLQFGPQAEAELEVRGADLGDMVLLADGGVGFRLDNLQRRALHPMWFSPERHFHYVLEFRMPMEQPRAQTLTLTAIATDLEPRRP